MQGLSMEESPQGAPVATPETRSAVVLPLASSARIHEDAGAFLRCHAPPTPVYLFSAEEARARSQAFTRGFPGRVSYAIKANPHPLMLETLHAAGIRAFDAASLAEIVAARALGGRVRVHFNNPVKSARDIATAYEELGVRSFALDDCIELGKLRAAVSDPARVELSVRFRLEDASAWYDFGSKFGASPREAVTLLRWVAAAGFRPSLAFHPGSQCRDPGSYVRHVEMAGAIAREARVRLHRLNVGGGFPVPYRDCRVPGLERFFSAIRRAEGAVFGEDGPALVCEPGRAMAAPTTSLLARVIHRRASGCLFLNDGIYGGLMEQLLVPLRPPARAWRDGRPLTGTSAEFTVFGPTCDSADRLPHPLPLPQDIQCGDWVEFGMAGAYGSATATRFNGFRSDRYVQVRRGFPCPATV